jgi:hypothetical protein
VAHEYPKGTTVSLSATASEGWQFDRWEVGGIAFGANESDISVTMDAEKAAVAYFSEVTAVPVIHHHRFCR